MIKLFYSSHEAIGIWEWIPWMVGFEAPRGKPAKSEKSGFPVIFLPSSQTKWIFQKGHSQNEAIIYHSGLENDSWIRFWLVFFPGK